MTKVKTVKPGDIAKLFKERRDELLERLNRLEQRQKEGWGYRQVLRRAHTVKSYKVRSHWALVPVKRKQ